MGKVSSKKKVANIKLPSSTIDEIKEFTQEATGQGAVEAALIYFIREARQRDLLKFLSSKRFRDDFDPLAIRSDDR